MSVEKGSRITTSPIPLKACRRIEKLLADQPRNLMLFTLGVQTGLRVGTLLALRVIDVRYLNPGDSIQVRESKTGKTNTLVINKTSYGAIQGYIASCDPVDHEPLFKSRKGDKALNVSTVSHMVKKWCKDAGLQDKHGSFAAHSMRKTHGTELRKKGVAIELISMRFNHSSLKVTERYLGITPKDQQEILMIDL